MTSFIHFVGWLLVGLSALLYWNFSARKEPRDTRADASTKHGMSEPVAMKEKTPANKESIRLHLKTLRKERAALQRNAEHGSFFSAWAHQSERRKHCKKLLHALRMHAPRTIAGYVPMPGEADIMPALILLHQRGWNITLPCIENNETHLRFRRWNPQDDLISGPHGIHQPAPFAPEALPQLILLPMLGFDREGNRIGMGAGWYDRTLAALHATHHFPELVGIAYDEQEIPSIPTEPHDQPVDGIVTPTRIHDCRLAR